MSGVDASFREPDWAGLWRQLVEASERYQRDHSDPARAKRYLQRLRAGPEALERSDPLVDFVLEELHPSETVLDIGAAAGRWSLRLARKARQVTAVEPSAELGQALVERAEALGLPNVRLVASPWRDASVESHDVVINSHAMYGTADLRALVRSMTSCARQRIYLVMRRIAPDGVMAELARRTLGHPHDSPNFTVGYNVLLGMGLAPNVVMERADKHWRDPHLEAAVARAKRHLYLGPDDSAHDQEIREVLARRLEPTADGLRWPDGTHSALVWWSVS